MAESCVQGRAVMIDLHAHYGRERKMVGYEDLMGVLEKDKVTVEQGDFVCLRTGFDQVLLEFDRKPDESVNNICAVLDGRDARLQQWVTDTGAGRADLGQLRRRGASRRGRASRTPTIAPRCRCTRIACSGSASISARSGT